MKTRDEKIRDLARRETTPSEYERFLPVSKGPKVAALGILALGAVSLPYRIFLGLKRLFQ